MPKINAILFDMDGVLVEAKDWHYAALNRALSLLGMEISRYDHLVTYDGLPTREKLEMLTVERGLPARLHPFINALKQQYTLELIYTSCKPVFHVEYAVNRLHKEGYRLAVCSNAVRNTVAAMLKRANLAHLFECLLSNEDVQLSKPDPEIYLVAMRQLGMTPSECLILEDNENGIKAAIASGAHLMRIKTVGDVNYENIRKRIGEIEQG